MHQFLTASGAVTAERTMTVQELRALLEGRPDAEPVVLYVDNQVLVYLDGQHLVDTRDRVQMMVKARGERKCLILMGRT